MSHNIGSTGGRAGHFMSPPPSSSSDLRPKTSPRYYRASMITSQALEQPTTFSAGSELNPISDIPLRAGSYQIPQERPPSSRPKSTGRRVLSSMGLAKESTESLPGSTHTNDTHDQGVRNNHKQSPSLVSRFSLDKEKPSTDIHNADNTFRNRSKAWGSSVGKRLLGGGRRTTSKDISAPQPLHKEPWNGASGRTTLVAPVRDRPGPRKQAFGSDDEYDGVPSIAYSVRRGSGMKPKNDSASTKSGTWTEGETQSSHAPPSLRLPSLSSSRKPSLAVPSTASGPVDDATSFIQEQFETFSITPLNNEGGMPGQHSRNSSTYQSPNEDRTRPSTAYDWERSDVSATTRVEDSSRRSSVNFYTPHTSFERHDRRAVSTSQTSSPELSSPAPTNSTAPSSPLLSSDTSMFDKHKTPVVVLEPTTPPPPQSIAPSSRDGSTQEGSGEKDDAESRINAKIEATEASLKDLARRRAAVESTIKELNSATNPMVYDYKTRIEARRSAQSLEAEITDIKKDQHDMGLKLTRYLKKREDLATLGDSSGGMWARRVIY